MRARAMFTAGLVTALIVFTGKGAIGDALVPVQLLLLGHSFTPDRFKAMMLPYDRIRLTWRDNARNETSFRLLVALRRADGNVKRKMYNLPPDTQKLDIDLQADGLMYTVPLSRYEFVLCAYGEGRKGCTDTLHFQIPSSLPIPSAPVAVTAEPVSGSSEAMTVRWTDTSTGEYGFRIYRTKSGENNFAEVGEVGPNKTLFVDQDLHPCTSYDYRVYAFNGQGFFNGFGQGSGITAPAPPLNPQASQGTVLYQVYLDWSDPSVCAAGYNLYRLNYDGSTWTKLNDIPTPTLKADVFNVDPGIQQFFRLTSVDASGHEGSMGNYVMGWAAAPTPVNNWASRGTDTGNIWLHWDAVQVTWADWPPTHQNLYADGYVVAEATSIDGSYTEHTPFTWDIHNPNPLLYRVTNADPGRHYFFKVAAIYKDRQDWDGDGDVEEYLQGEWSAPMEGWRGVEGSTPPSYLPAPASISATDGTYPFKVQIIWSAVSGATAYEVYRGSSPWGPWQKIRTVTSTAMDNTSGDSQFPVITNTGYYYFVCPVDGSGVRGYCSPYDGGFAASHLLQR